MIALLYMSWEDRRECSVFNKDNQVKALPLFFKHNLLSVETGERVMIKGKKNRIKGKQGDIVKGRQ